MDDDADDGDGALDYENDDSYHVDWRTVKLNRRPLSNVECAVTTPKVQV